MTAQPNDRDWDRLDALVDEDPIALRDAAWRLTTALAVAEHRATRAEAQSEARRINVEYWKEKAVARGISFREARAERDQNLEDLGEAEVRIRAVRVLLDRAHDEFENPDEADIRRALDGDA